VQNILLPIPDFFLCVRRTTRFCLKSNTIININGGCLNVGLLFLERYNFDFRSLHQTFFLYLILNLFVLILEYTKFKFTDLFVQILHLVLWLKENIGYTD
jgi:hypothetical protein